MITTWIIGNGFDLNLNLNTGYKYFLEQIYLSESANQYSAEKKKLISAMGSSHNKDNWSDLELMSGQVTESYSLDEKELFIQGFEEMVLELRDHLCNEQNRFEKDLIDKVNIDEFWKSLTRLPERLCSVGAEKIGNYRQRREIIHYRFISLNYTNVFDRLLEKTKTAHGDFDTRFSYTDVAHDVLHLHGTLSETGGLVFCVSNPNQICNTDFAQDPDFLELWLKQNRNTFFGNHRERDAAKIVNSSELIVIFGCSYGQTDEYLWNMVGTWLLQNERRRLLVLDYNMPPIGSANLLKTQSTRQTVRERLFKSMNLSPTQSASLLKRLWIESSTIVFRNLLED